MRARPLLRLLLASGAAAGLALSVRVPASARVGDLFGRLTGAAAPYARALVRESRDPPTLPMPGPAPEPGVASVPASPTEAVAAGPRVDEAAGPRVDEATGPRVHEAVGPRAKLDPSPRPAASAAKGGPLRFKREDVESAIASRLGGATTRLVRDAEGHPVGLALHGVSRLASFGVRDGDVLLSVSGHPVRTPEEGFAALGALEHARKVVFLLRRGDAAYSVPVELGE